MARERAKAKPEPLARGGAKAKPRLREVAKTRAAHKAKAAERGPPPRLLRFSWTLCLRLPTSCTFRVAATTRAALAGTPGSATTSGTTVRCEPSSVNGWRQRRAHIAASARFLANPVALPAGHAAQSPAEGPARAKAGGGQSIGEATDAAHGGGPPSPTGDSYESSTEAAEEANPARPSTPTPWARRTASNNGSQECCTPGCAARLPGAGCP